MSNRGKFLIGAGILNMVHGGTHIIQFVQSMFLIGYSHGGCDADSWLHNPWVSLLWGIIGIVTLIIGIKDFKHHEKCDH